MICKSYDQLTIVEKTQFIGKLMHLVQTNEKAFIHAEQMINKANEEGLFTKVTICPVKETQPLLSFGEAELSSSAWQTDSLPYYSSHHSMFVPSHSPNPVINIINRTKDSIHRSYQKLFARMAS
jgi:hypothetical protein